MIEQSIPDRIGSILKLWEEHNRAKFPKGLSGEEIDGIDLTLLDADMAGCIDAFLKRSTKYTLDISRTAVLKSCYRDLSIATVRLAGKQRDYFQRLETIARLIMEVLAERAC